MTNYKRLTNTNVKDVILNVCKKHNNMHKPSGFVIADHDNHKSISLVYYRGYNNINALMDICIDIECTLRNTFNDVEVFACACVPDDVPVCSL